MMVSAREPLAVIPRDCGSNQNRIVMVGVVRRNVGKNGTDFLFCFFLLARFARFSLFFPFFLKLALLEKTNRETENRAKRARKKNGGKRDSEDSLIH